MSRKQNYRSKGGGIFNRFFLKKKEQPLSKQETGESTLTNSSISAATDGFKGLVKINNTVVSRAPKTALKSLTLLLNGMDLTLDICTELLKIISNVSTRSLTMLTYLTKKSCEQISQCIREYEANISGDESDKYNKLISCIKGVLIKYNIGFTKSVEKQIVTLNNFAILDCRVIDDNLKKLGYNFTETNTINPQSLNTRILNLKEEKDALMIELKSRIDLKKQTDMNELLGYQTRLESYKGTASKLIHVGKNIMTRMETLSESYVKSVYNSNPIISGYSSKFDKYMINQDDKRWVIFKGADLNETDDDVDPDSIHGRLIMIQLELSDLIKSQHPTLNMNKRGDKKIEEINLKLDEQIDKTVAIIENKVDSASAASEAVTEKAVTEEAVTEEAVTEEAAASEAPSEDAVTEEADEKKINGLVAQLDGMLVQP
jgi:hypothetical protein